MKKLKYRGKKWIVEIIFADDMGYGDWNGAGHPTIHTPNLNRMAEEGVFMMQFYSAFFVCSPSCAALLTGRYPIRTGVGFFTTFKVLYYYRRDRLAAIRAGKYKLHFAKTTRAYHLGRL
ncbi:MAG: sulfatase-like hydrolase/transferase [Calditrichaeota bacterium]|nr:sulfatase-like hydrolase/transferase [Calditrichota bacterium]